MAFAQPLPPPIKPEEATEAAAPGAEPPGSVRKHRLLGGKMGMGWGARSLHPRAFRLTNLGAMARFGLLGIREGREWNCGQHGVVGAGPGKRFCSFGHYHHLVAEERQRLFLPGGRWWDRGRRQEKLLGAAMMVGGVHPKLGEEDREVGTQQRQEGSQQRTETSWVPTRENGQGAEPDQTRAPEGGLESHKKCSDSGPGAE